MIWLKGADNRKVNVLEKFGRRDEWTVELVMLWNEEVELGL